MGFLGTFARLKSRLRQMPGNQVRYGPMGLEIKAQVNRLRWGRERSVAAGTAMNSDPPVEIWSHVVYGDILWNARHTGVGHVDSETLIAKGRTLALLAPHTSGPRDVPRCGALSLLQKTPHYRGGIQQKPLIG